jgi:tetratricopeptide (TPR) repeat protein
MDRVSIGPAGPNPVAEEQFRKGFEFAKGGDLDEAILNVEAALAVAPEESRYHDLLGTLYAKKGLYEMAVGEWKRSIECDPDRAEVFRRIETADKMKAQPPARAAKWNWLAVIVLSLWFVGSLAWGIHQLRSRSADTSRIQELQELTANIDSLYVKKTEHDALLGEKRALETVAASKEATFAATLKELEDFKSSGKYVQKAELVKERELCNRLQSEIAALRQQNDTLNKQLASVQDATKVLDISAEIAKKDGLIKNLQQEYKNMNDERNRLENDLKKEQLQTAKLRGSVDDLLAQHSKMLSATESASLRTEMDALKAQLTKVASATGAGVAQAPAVGNEEVLFLLNNTLSAVQHVLDGKKPQALDSLKKVESKAPAGSSLKEIIERLQTPPLVAEAAPKPKATEEPAPKPTPKPKPQPTAEPTAVKVAKPAASPVDDSGASIPKPLPGKKPVKSSPVTPPKESVSPTPAPAKAQRSVRIDTETESQANSLLQQKKSLTDRALALYKQRKFDEAWEVIGQAYRIDSKDPRVNQLRNAIGEQRGNR